jgi:N,N'-diacetyllegionaminate synthase
MSVYIISELCGQWGGDMRRAEQMILQSKLAGADAVKVQLWDTYRMPGSDRELWEHLSMTRDQFLALKEFADRLNIDFFASPFHRDRFNWITDAGIKINKIASSMLEWDIEFCQDMVGDGMLTYCSLGKWDDRLVYPFKNSNVKYFHCVAKYPHTEEEAIELMPESFDDTLVGYSDHSIGIDACKEAVRRGATIIEKHFTTNKKLQCKTESAHVCSMTMNELRNLRDFCDQYQITK